jgi:tetratricopeptide (TPR) repeat protein
MICKGFSLVLIRQGLLLFFVFLASNLLFAQNTDDDQEDKIGAEIASLKKQYGKNIENLRDFYWRYLAERSLQSKAEAANQKKEAVFEAWRELLTNIEALESKKEFTAIISQINLFNDHKIKAITVDKLRLKTYFEKLEASDRAIYEKVKQKEIEILFDEFLVQSNELAVASKFSEMREIFLQLISENPRYNKNAQLIEISRVLNVLLASRNQAFTLLKLSVGKKMRLRGIEVTLLSFDGETIQAKDYQNKEKSYLFSEFHLMDFLGINGIKSYDGEFIYQIGLKFYLEGQYKKAHESFMLALKKGINCRSYLFAVEAKLGDIQRTTLLEASQLIDNKKYREAELIVQRFLKEKPGDLEGLFMQGEIRAGQNRISEAYGLFEDIHKKFPEHEETIRQLADLGHHLKLSDAYLWSEQLLKNNPEDKDHLLIVCKEMQKQKNGEKFLEYAIKVQKSNSNLIEPNILLAEAYAINKKYPESIEVYQKLLKEKPTQWDAQQGLGETMCLQGKKDEAVVYYENLLVTLKSERKKDTIRKRIKELLNK